MQRKLVGLHRIIYAICALTGQAAHHIIRLQEISGGVCHKVLCTLFIPAMRDTAERKWASGTLWERSMQRAELPCGALPFVYLTRDRREPPQQRGGFRIFRGARRRHGGLQHALHCFWRKAPRFVIARRPEADVAISRHMPNNRKTIGEIAAAFPRLHPKGTSSRFALRAPRPLRGLAMTNLWLSPFYRQPALVDSIAPGGDSPAPTTAVRQPRHFLLFFHKCPPVSTRRA